ncbi:MAG: hypothetical protein JSV44_11805 [Candidatus Zixiibacteriota bacterium]|nr:MAG: hypothetical protein JSV44_11805 [candidate division Zixibacteria bacterium]
MTKTCWLIWIWIVLFYAPGAFYARGQETATISVTATVVSPVGLVEPLPALEKTNSAWKPAAPPEHQITLRYPTDAGFICRIERRWLKDSNSVQVLLPDAAADGAGIRPILRGKHTSVATLDLPARLPDNPASCVYIVTLIVTEN